MKVDHSTDDLIELKLSQNVEYYYDILYRFKPVVKEKRFLFFRFNVKSKEKWHYINKYYGCNTDNLSSSSADPDYWLNWDYEVVNLGKESGRQLWETIRNKIKTYKDLDRWFNISSNREKYENDVKEYQERLKKVKNYIKQIII